MKNRPIDGCLMLFLLPFILVGIFALSINARDIYLQIQTNDFIPVEAKIINVDLIIDYDETTTYKVICNYNYTYQNKNYKNNVISIGYGQDNIDNHEELFDLLKYSNKITAFIDPENPNDAVLAKGSNSSTKSLIIFSIIWNSVILFFLFKRNKKSMLILLFIFIGGIITILSEVLYTNFKQKINIIEKKSEEEIKKIENEGFDEIFDEEEINILKIKD